ncbi:MAG: NADH-quinone oxidoreductase subunit C [SAR324 cluster bacterium]|nr:NADH-quinone oxidoreductase subunit C [SAR324 cluster bacterium]
MESEELFQYIASLEAAARPSEKPSDLPTIEVPPEHFLSLMQQLREDPRLYFNMLQVHTAVDWVKKGIFELLYQLYSTKDRQSLRVLVELPRENPVIASVCSIWRIAEWQEREVYDFFGVLYEGHPDLRRLFLEDDWKGFPMRKDYEDDFMLEPGQ